MSINTYQTMGMDTEGSNHEHDPELGIKYELHHAYPEKYPPVKIPSKFPMPSHITQDTVSKTLKADSEGNFIIFFNPVTAAWESIRNGTQSNFLDITFA